MNNIAEFLKRSSEKAGFKREVYNDTKCPTHQSNITVFPFFGDLGSSMVLSSFLLNRYKEMRGSKYFILATWPGHRSLFSNVDEFWSLASHEKLDDLYKESKGFENLGKLATLYHRNLNMYFEDVIGANTFTELYDNGFKKAFVDKFKIIVRSLPSIPSISVLGEKFGRDIRERAGLKVFVHPSKWTCVWSRGRMIRIPSRKRFWVALVDRLLKEGFVPVLHNSYLTFDLSAEFTDRCVYVVEDDIGKIMGAMRSIGCVLDVFSDISRISLVARCPFLAVTERNKYVTMQDYALDDLCGIDLPKRYIFTFPTIIESGSDPTWQFNLFDGIVQKLNDFIPTLDINTLPTTAESTVELPYNTVRRRKQKKMGTRFIKVPREERLDG